MSRGDLATLKAFGIETPLEEFFMASANWFRHRHAQRAAHTYNFRECQKCERTTARLREALPEARDLLLRPDYTINPTSTKEDIVDTQDRLTGILIEKLRAIGPERVTRHAQLAKLKEEVAEVEEAINDGDVANLMSEVADVIIVCLTLARILGYRFGNVLAIVLAKSFRNADRNWAASGDTAQHVEEVV